MWRRRSIILVFSSCLVASVGVCHAHSGRTDASGGHYNRKTGVYHSHGISSASSNTGVTGLSRMTAWFTPRESARTSPPPKKNVEARAYDPNPLIARVTDESVRFPSEEEPIPKSVEPQRDFAKEERAKKLFAFAKRQIDEGKRDVGIKYLRRIIDEYDETSSAPDARDYLKKLREAEPFKEWIDKSGRHSVRAMFIRLEKETVYLKREDGRIIAVDVRDFSHTDRLYIIYREGIHAKSKSF
jgi:hypothetical protein